MADLKSKFPPSAASLKLKEAAAAVDLPAKLLALATAAQLGKFSYRFGVYAAVVGPAVPVVCLTCEASAKGDAKPPDGWERVAHDHWRLTAPSKDVINVHITAKDQLTLLGKVGCCIELKVGAKTGAMTQGLVLRQHPKNQTPQLWSLIPGHGLVGKAGEEATRRVSCCADPACGICNNPQLKCSICVLGKVKGPSEPAIQATNKKLIASGATDILVVTSQTDGPEFLDLAAYKVPEGETIPLSVQEGLRYFGNMQVHAELEAMTKAVAALVGITGVGAPMDSLELEHHMEQTGRGLYAFKKGITTGWTLGRVAMVERESITVSAFPGQTGYLADRGDCGSIMFVLDPTAPIARPIGFVFAGTFLAPENRQPKDNILVIPFSAALSRLADFLGNGGLEYASGVAYTF
jgi:hypothetical protein